MNQPYINYFLHDHGICESHTVGAGTKIWAFAHVLPGAEIGCNVNICDHTFIENEVVIGDRVTIKNFVAIWDGTHIEDDVFIGPNVVFTNDKYPRSKRYLPSYPQTTICKGASIGAGAIILPGINVGMYAMVAAGALVSKDVEPFSLVAGSPAVFVGKVCKCGARLQKTDAGLQCSWGDWQGAGPSPEMRCSKCQAEK